MCVPDCFLVVGRRDAGQADRQRVRCTPLCRPVEVRKPKQEIPMSKTQKPPSAPKPAPNPRPKEGHDARHAQDFGNALTEAIRQRLTYLSRVMRASCSFSHAFSCSRD